MVNAVPNYPNQVPITSSTGVKTATPDILVFDEDGVPIEIMTDLIFEDIGGQEILSIARNDTINGQEVIYRPIKNITSLNFQYNPNNILALQGVSEAYFKNFPISFNRHVPECGTGYDIIGGVDVPNCKYVYLDPKTGDLVINVVKLAKGNQVEVQVMNAGVLFSDTIYEVES